MCLWPRGRARKAATTRACLRLLPLTGSAVFEGILGSRGRGRHVFVLPWRETKPICFDDWGEWRKGERTSRSRSTEPLARN
ncbi:hypothetical protein K438DRAFT_1801494, partial [Mycena galopus ATCC 62051]